MATHGEYDATRGWFSTITNRWHKDPSKIGTVRPEYVPSALDREDWARMQAKARGDFRTDPQMDKLISLRDSDRPEDRAKFERIATGRTAMTLGRYENAKAQAEDGGQ